MGKIIIGTNVTDEDIYVEDLAGQYFGINEPVTLSDLYTPGEISLSEILEDHVINERIILNNGEEDIDPEEAAKIINNDPVQNLTELFDVGEPPGTYSEEMMVHDGTSVIWVENIFANGINTGIHFPLTHHSNHDYMSNKETQWEIAATFLYDGTKNWTPSTFSVICSQKDEETGYARLYDYTNNKEIASLSWTNTDKGIAYTTTINNLPNIKSLIELQYKSSKKGKEIRLHYLMFY